MGFVGFGRYQKAGGVLIETMHDARPFDPTDARQARAAVGDQCIDQRAGSMAGSRMNHQAAGLVDDDDRIVFIDDVEWNLLPRRRGWLGWRQGYGDDVAGFDDGRGIADRALSNHYMAG